jgi:Secretion system C-terminal sorting domain
MKALLKNWLLPTNSICFSSKSRKGFMPFLLFIICPLINISQIANYVSNGSFEILNPNASSYAPEATKYWGAMDTTKESNILCSLLPGINNAPYLSTGFQFPRTGSNFVLAQFYCGTNSCNASNSRFYLRNRLKKPLQAGKTYCAKYYVVNTNNNIVAIDSYGIYFGDNTLDTINYCMNVITYLNPQIQYTGGIITDTLNWTPITGTFVANGNEKYMVLGNFKSNAATNTLQTNPPSFAMTADIYIDDVSVMDLNLPAFAGADIWGIPTNTVYLGRPCDVGIDEACMWYKLPNTTTAIDTAAGITITVAATTETYMVKQDICGVIKFDTVVVYSSGVGLTEFQKNANSISLYPNPTNRITTLDLGLLIGQDIKILITNCLGSLIREEDIHVKTINQKINLDLSTKAGIYLINIKNSSNESITKKLVIAD